VIGEIIVGMSEADYFAHPALSSTGARKLLDSPARFRWAQDHPQPHKDAYDLGSSVHTKVLGTGHEVAVLDYPDLRSKAARDAKDEARAAGLVPMLKSQWVTVEAMAEAVLSHPTARMLFEQPGAPETSVLAVDDDTGIDLRARFDYLPNTDVPDAWTVDLKTTGKAASADDFTKAVASYGYDVQQAHYLDTYGYATGNWDTRMAFVVVETAAPHMVAVHQLSPQYGEIGHTRASRAREIYARCLATNTWPGYDEAITELHPPTWLIYANEEIEV
jgi:hypothetical protein